ncbi:MAG: adenylate/guanylate cyclase domain-containing protein [Methylococcales bacterium]|nr:adenylate/guanylate cyclase domain-containing protein [Methylococcales bacterium]
MTEKKNRSTTRHLFVFNANKLAGLFSFILVLSLIGLSVLITFKQTPLIEKQTAILRESLIYQVAYTLKNPLLASNHLAVKNILDKLYQQESIIGITLYNKDYSVANTQGFTTEPINFPTELATYQQQTDILNSTFINSTNATSYTMMVNYDALVFGYISVSFRSQLLENTQKEILQNLLWVILASGSICLLALIYLKKYTNNPLDDMMNTNSILNNEKNYDEMSTFIQSFNEMDKGLLQKDKVEAIFSRYVSPQVAKEVLNDLDSLVETELGGEHLTASVFFADIVGFTSLSESMDPQDISELLNVYFSKVTEVVSFCGGHVDKFIGDCAMVVFGVPVKKEQHAFDCIACAWMVLELLHQLNHQREAEGKIRVEFRIGVNSGTMLAGNMGSNERMEYTVVGDSVNLASRLCGSAEPGELIITEDVFAEQNLNGLIDVDDKDFIKLRGKKLPIKTLVVSDILTPFKQQMLAEIPLIIKRCEQS